MHKLTDIISLEKQVPKCLKLCLQKQGCTNILCLLLSIFRPPIKICVDFANYHLVHDMEINVPQPMGGGGGQMSPKRWEVGGQMSPNRWEGDFGFYCWSHWHCCTLYCKNELAHSNQIFLDRVMMKELIRFLWLWPTGLDKKNGRKIVNIFLPI